MKKRKKKNLHFNIDQERIVLKLKRIMMILSLILLIDLILTTMIISLDKINQKIK